MSFLNKIKNTIIKVAEPMNQIRPTTNKLAFAANFLLAFLLPFSLTGKINAKAFDHTMFWLYLVLCIINRPNHSIRKAFCNVRDAMHIADNPSQLARRKVYCAGLWIVKFLLRIAMLVVLIYHTVLSYIPFIGKYTDGIYACGILYVFILSNLNLGVSIGRYFSNKLSKKIKIVANIICFFASTTGFYLFSKARLWKHLVQIKELTNVSLSCYFFATLLFVQIGFIFYELTIGKESTT